MNEMEITFSALLVNENFARTSVGAFLTPLNPTIDEVIEMKTIVAEAVSNAIIHGYNNNENCKVVLKMSISEDRTVQLIVKDFGKGIENVEEVKAPFYTTLKDLEHAGMGMTIIDTLADSFEIVSEVGIGTKLIMTRQLKEHLG